MCSSTKRPVSPTLCACWPSYRDCETDLTQIPVARISASSFGNPQSLPLGRAANGQTAPHHAGCGAFASLSARLRSPGNMRGNNAQAGKAEESMISRFPAPWRIVELPTGFAVEDATGLQLGVFYGRASDTAGHTGIMTMDEARQPAHRGVAKTRSPVFTIPLRGSAPPSWP
jgi:hypothetical protein